MQSAFCVTDVTRWTQPTEPTDRKYVGSYIVADVADALPLLNPVKTVAELSQKKKNNP